jgi:peptidoglycan hydrolase-like protein with peptidoglycan-binding domain
MKNLKLTQRSTSRTLLTQVLTPAVVAAFLGMTLMSTAYAADPITAQLDFGARGTNVTNLQAFFATNPAIYPEGMVTGYYGALTRAAVMRFQATYGIVSSGTAATTGYGRVGPTTLARINQLMASGWGNTPSMDASGPALYSVAHAVGQTSNTITWITSESATSRIYYSTSPVKFNEGGENSAGFGATTGQVASADSNLRTSHQISLTGLLPNTVYYYTLASTDASGNVSLYGPNNTFRTNQ